MDKNCERCGESKPALTLYKIKGKLTCSACFNAKCEFCKEKITYEEMDSDKANFLLGGWSHSKCDEEAHEKIDKKMHVVKSQSGY